MAVVKLSCNISNDEYRSLHDFSWLKEALLKKMEKMDLSSDGNYNVDCCYSPKGIIITITEV